MNCTVCGRPLELDGTCDSCVGHGGSGGRATVGAICTVCGRVPAWPIVDARPKTMQFVGRGDPRWCWSTPFVTTYSLDCERAGRLAVLARAEKADARVAVLEAFVRAWDVCEDSEDWSQIMEAARKAVGEVPGE